MVQNKHVMVLAGGWSGERAVSLRSGKAILASCERLGWQATWMDLQAKEDLQKLHDVAKDTVIFNALHGGAGENGHVSAYLDCLGLPYTGSGALASALGMDKYRSKMLFSAIGLPVLPSYLLHTLEDFSGCGWDYPLCFKPYDGGSSLGTHCVRNKEEVEAAFLDARQYGLVLVEPWLDIVEYTVGWVDDLCLPIIWVDPGTQVFYDYAAKYQSGQTKYHIPCGLSDEKIALLHDYTRQALKVLDCRGWARADFFYDKKNEVFYLSEVNLVPGMTETSLVPKAAAAIGMSFDDLVARIVSIATYDQA